MGLRFLVFILLSAVSAIASGQEVVYVNTDNLVLRDRPEKMYNVFAILHASCPLKVERYEDGYKNDKAVTNKFYQVSISYNSDNGIHHYVGGWVLKKFVVTDLSKITVPGVDTASQSLVSIVPLVRYMGDDEHNPNKGNAAQFLPPKYKGGEKQPGQVARIYHSGPRGGCYYLSGKGKKVYVDKKFCKDK